MTDRNTYSKALNMTGEAIYQLERAREALSGARGLGVWDILGGGFISTLLKHGRMDDAEDHIRCAGRLLDNVKALVPGVYCNRIEEEDHGAARLFDLLLDGLLSDVYVQGCIRDRQRAVDELLRQTRALEYDLKRYAEGA